MINKNYEIKTVKENELYTVTAFDNGDKIIHVNINENEMLSLSECYELNGFIRKGATE